MRLLWLRHVLTVCLGASLDSNVIRVVAEDPDSQQLTYSITSGNNGNVFRINSTGNILVTRTLDRETNASYTLAVLAVDSAGNEGTTSVRITLTDENDEAPIFSQTAYTAFISENSPQGTPVLPVIGSSTIAIQAVDLDQPNTDNSRVSYQLEGPDASRFNIDRTSGVVSVARGEWWGVVSVARGEWWGVVSVARGEWWGVVSVARGEWW